jgi:antirestriction protein ArdC
MEKKNADQIFAEKIITMLEAGTAPWVRGWEVGEALTHMPHNPLTKAIYKGANIVRLWIASEEKGYEDPRWMTFKQAAEKGWSVKKGEKSTMISFYSPKVKEVEHDGETETKMYFMHKTFCVFNAAQVEGVDPLVRDDMRHEWEPQQAGEMILDGSGANIVYEGFQPAYLPGQDKIRLPERSLFKSAEYFYSAAIHELAHWTGAKHRLNRDFSTSRGTAEYAREELRAEIASWMIACETGIPHDPSEHASYIGHWIEAIKKDHREIFRACADAEKIKDYLMDMGRQITTAM